MPPYKIPKRVKYRKEFRRARDRKATKGNYVAFGDYGLQALEGCWLKSNVIEAGRIAAQQLLKRQAGLQEAARDPHGQGQGGRGLLGGAGASRDGLVRARRCAGRPGQGGDGSCGDEDAGSVPIRRSPTLGVGT